MRRFLDVGLSHILRSVKLFPTAMTTRNELQHLLQRLYPVACDKALIRLGPKGDGGYLVPDDLVGIEACFSPGVRFLSGFEKDCAELGMKIFLADRSVDRAAEEHNAFRFTKKFVGVTSNDDFMTIDSWVAASLPQTRSDLLLQIDIESYEYEVLLSASDALMRRFRIIVVEFHHLDQFWSKPFFGLAVRTFDKILQTHTCVHLHPNNHSGSLKKGGLDIPRVMEFTFLRNDRIENASYQSAFPNSLDYDNTTKPTLVLPACWHHHG